MSARPAFRRPARPLPALALLGLLATPALATLNARGDGTVADSQTGLQWDACAWGRTWSAGTCAPGSTETSTETFSWANALAAAVTANRARHRGHDDWRLPNRNELESLVNIGATSGPAIAPAFPWPYTASQFWSATSHPLTPAKAWQVDFSQGGLLATDKGTSLRVLLVRGGGSSAGSANGSSGSGGGGGFDLTGDLTPPTLTQVGVSGTTLTTTTLKATSDEAATGYWLVLARGAAPPTAAQVRAGTGYGGITLVTQGSGSMAAGVATPFPVSGLSPNTPYDLYLAAQDTSVNANLSAAILVPFTTLATPAQSAHLGPIPTRKPGVTADLEVTGCATFTAASFVDAPPGSPPGSPPGKQFPYGLLDVGLASCDGTASLTVTYSEPLPGGAYYKEVAGAYSVFPATVAGNRITLSLTDNGSGDDDPTPGRIHDPSGLGVDAGVGSEATPVPLLGPLALAGLSLLLAGLPGWRRRTGRPTA